MSIAADRSWSRARRLALGLLLLAVPACGLSDYEALMMKAQKSEERFLEEEKYLDAPLMIPRPKNDKGEDQPLAKVFLRPPKGIESKSQPEPRDSLIWQYALRAQGAPSGGYDFSEVDLAFGSEEKDFAQKVVGLYPAAGQFTQTSQQIVPFGQTNPITFDTWEFGSVQSGYSINVTRNLPKPLAIVYIYNKARLATVRKSIELSLQSLALDNQVTLAGQRFLQKSPWQLTPALTP